MRISRESAVVPAAPERTVEVPELGEALIRPLPLSEHMRILDAHREDGVGYVLEMAAATVVLDDGEPLFSLADWDAYAGRFPAGWKVVAAAVLQSVGRVDDAKKNSESDPS